MDNTQQNSCMICNKFSFPHAVGYIDESVLNCTCGNKIHMRNTPAIYVGNMGKIHILIIPYPGCTVCGRPAHAPTNYYYGCKSEEELKEQMREVYHNDGLRN